MMELSKNKFIQIKAKEKWYKAENTGTTRHLKATVIIIILRKLTYHTALLVSLILHRCSTLSI